jgi:hypothetical protein
MKKLTLLTIGLLSLSLNVFANGCDGETNGRNDIYSSVDMYSCTDLLGTNMNFESAAGRPIAITHGASVCISDYTLREPKEGRAKRAVFVTSNINDIISHDREHVSSTSNVNRHFLGDGFDITKGVFASELTMRVSSNGSLLTVTNRKYGSKDAYGMFTCRKSTISMN